MGLYHGVLLIADEGATHRASRRGHLQRHGSRVPQIRGMFLLTNLGWLLFRETEPVGDRSRPDAVAIR